MQIISLTEIQFKNYSRIHSRRNYFQSVEFANFQKNRGYQVLYIGLLDDSDNVIAAALILGKTILGKYLYGYVPGGYLINYDDVQTFKKFSELLKKYLYKLNYVYIIVNSLITIKEYDKKGNIISNHDKYIKLFETSEYVKSKQKELNVCAKLNLIKKDSVYNNFSRFVKRNIKDAKFKGIKIIKGSVNDVEKFYYFIKKKDKHNINYYKGLFNNLNTENNKFEIYFAYMDTNEYLKNCHIALNKEKVRNEKLKQKLLKNNNETNIVYKMQSDKLVDKYDHELLKAIQLNSQYKDGTVVATVGIIKTNNIINFIVDGYDNNLKFIKASYLIKWEIIKEYLKSGYTNFNLGYLPEYQEKFKGLYLSKIGFNCNIHKEPGQYNLIINNMIYKFINIADKDKYN